MQTSSKFFDKNLLTLQDETQNYRRGDKFLQSRILQDPLRLKDELTPWAETNPKYNFKTQRLIRFKYKIMLPQSLESNQQEKQKEKQSNAQFRSNLFNFKKNNKGKNSSTILKVKRKRRSPSKNNQQDSSCKLPPIQDQQQPLQEKASDNQENIKNIELKQQPDKKNIKSKSPPYIQSISIRQYLNKLKERQKIIASSPQKQAKSLRDSNQPDYFSSIIEDKKSLKKSFKNIINQKAQTDVIYRYAPIKSPQKYSPSKKSNLSHFQSIDHSFQIYKKAVETEIQGKLGIRKKNFEIDKSIDSLLGQKNLFKSNIPLSLLFSPLGEGVGKKFASKSKQSSLEKNNTISYDQSHSRNDSKSLTLPKVTKNFSFIK